MENTIENKLKFLASHLYQEVIFNNEITGQLVGISPKVLLDLEVVEEYDNDTPIIKKWCSSDTALLLTPIENISDEDAIEVGNLYINSDINIEIIKDKNYLLGVGKRICSIYNANAQLFVNIFDFLRSKGYVLPYLGLSVEELVELGWVKLKD